jgi:predicted phage-related endonuclease
MSFPDCEIHRLPQHLEDGSSNPEWLELRKGVLTASEFGMWLVKCTTATAKKAKEAAICKLIAETAELWEPENKWMNEQMQRGLDLEPEAVAAFEKFTGKEVEHVGFCRSLYGLFGCSPDGLIVGENGGLEGKVPLPSTHIKYRRTGELPDEYKLQVHGSMAVTGADHWWFQSWNPRVANLRIRIERDQFTEDLLAGLKAFSRDVETALAEEKAAWEVEFGKGAK